MRAPRVSSPGSPPGCGALGVPPQLPPRPRLAGAPCSPCPTVGTHPACARAPRRHLAQPQASLPGLAVALSCVPLGCAGPGPVGLGRCHGDAVWRDVLGTVSWLALLGQDGTSW